MTTHEQKALELALEALEHMCYHTCAKVGYKSKIVETAITIIEEALAVDKESLTTEAQQSNEQVDEQTAFEEWLYRVCPSGDVESVQHQWESSSEYEDLYTHPPVPTAQLPESPM